VGIGNAPYSTDNIAVLEQYQEHPDLLVREHIIWALQQQREKQHQSVLQSRQQQRLIRIIQLGLPRDA
jgi:epoxyqueuosine reductase